MEVMSGTTRTRLTRRERRLLAEVETSPFAWELRALVRERRRYEAPATWLLIKLTERAQPANKNSPLWPKTPNQVGKMLNKFMPSLRIKGVAVSYHRHGKYGRLWLIRQQNR